MSGDDTVVGGGGTTVVRRTLGVLVVVFAVVGWAGGWGLGVTVRLELLTGTGERLVLKDAAGAVLAGALVAAGLEAVDGERVTDGEMVELAVEGVTHPALPTSTPTARAIRAAR